VHTFYLEGYRASRFGAGAVGHHDLCLHSRCRSKASVRVVMSTLSASSGI
jgi:hypothetical protein